MSLTFSRLTVVVTGASGGLGTFLVKHFCQTGARVIGVDRVMPEQTAVDAGSFDFILAHLGEQSGADEAAANIQRLSGKVDILVNAAGRFALDPEPGATANVLSQLWRDNLCPTVLLTLGLKELLLKGKSPLVVNIASVDAIVASGGQACEVGIKDGLLYASCKGAVLSFGQALAMNWAREQIRVHTLCPTLFLSPMTQELLKIPGKIAELESFIPLQRLCEPADIAVAIECLYRLRHTTGHVLPIDGGYLCR